MMRRGAFEGPFFVRRAARAVRSRRSSPALLTALAAPAAFFTRTQQRSAQSSSSSPVAYSAPVAPSIVSSSRSH